MKFLAILVGLLATAEVYFATTGQLGLNGGIGLLVAAPFAGVWASRELTPNAAHPAGRMLRAQREIIFAYECLILGSANALAGPHVISSVATLGAAILACGQSLILWFVCRNPRLLQPVEHPPSVRSLSVRFVILGFIYLGATILACAIFIPRSLHATVRTIPVELQWPGIALLYAFFGCLAVGLASEHARGSTWLYWAVALVSGSTVLMEYVGRRNWYFLALSLISFLVLVPGWPGSVDLKSSDASLKVVAGD